MTSGAGQALNPVRLALEAMAEAYGNGVLRQQAVTALAALDGFEQEVRDEIRARVEALPGMNGRHDAVGGALEVSREAVLSAISSSSATETQDGERGECLAVIPPDESIQFCMKPEGHEGPHGATETQDERCPVHTFVRLRDCEVHGPKATETQDGERPGLREAAERARAHVERMARMENDADWTLFLMAVERLIEHAEAATPTPDDRDREVERIAAVLRSIDHPTLPLDRNSTLAAIRLYDAGLRASGGD